MVFHKNLQRYPNQECRSEDRVVQLVRLVSAVVLDYQDE